MSYQLLLSTFLLFMVINPGTSQEPNCQFTIHGGPAGAGKKCAFPFIIGGRSYSSCTTVMEGDRRPWCATKVDTKRRHDIIGNNWGYCDKRCPFINNRGVIESTTFGPGQQSPTTRRPRPFVTTSRRPRRTTTPTTRTPILDQDQIIIGSEKSQSGQWLPDPAKQECGLKLDTGFILGGTDAKLGEFPFSALMGYPNTDVTISPYAVLYRCGGTLINRRYVITAAHCHLPGDSRNEIVEVVLGDFDVTIDPDCENGCAPVQRFTPQQIVRHKNYNAQSGAPQNDIALVRLNGLVNTVNEDFSLPVMAACLPRSEEDDDFDTLMVVGWGMTSNDDVANDIRSDGVGSSKLQKLQVPFVPRNLCALHFTDLTENNICAGGKEGQDSCGGDSGGPLVNKAEHNKSMFLLGIVSAGSRICGVGQPGIYTRTSRYIAWIKDNLKA